MDTKEAVQLNHLLTSMASICRARSGLIRADKLLSRFRHGDAGRIDRQLESAQSRLQEVVAACLTQLTPPGSRGGGET